MNPNSWNVAGLRETRKPRVNQAATRMHLRGANLETRGVGQSFPLFTYQPCVDGVKASCRRIGHVSAQSGSEIVPKCAAASE